jgi:hypothetical protein
VINDHSLFLASQVKLFRMDGKPYSGKFKKEMYVYYFLNSDGKITKAIIDTGY